MLSLVSATSSPTSISIGIQLPTTLLFMCFTVHIAKILKTLTSHYYINLIKESCDYRSWHVMTEYDDKQQLKGARKKS